MIKIFFPFFLFQLQILAGPSWINSPMTFCPPTELCVVGEASGALGAESAGRESLAKVFSTKIKSSHSIVTTSESSTSEGMLEGSVDEETYGQILEFTEEVIEGSFVKERFEDSEAHFVLISLNKRKAADLLKDRMKNIDEEIKSFIKDGRRSSLNKALKKLKIRSSLHDKYRILKGIAYSSGIKKAEILKLKRLKRDLGTKVSLEVHEISPTQEILKSIKFNLVDNDFIINKNNADFFIKVSLIKESQYIKVKGFVKFKFILNVKSFDKSENQIGSLKYEIIQTGRTQGQSYDKALPGINSFINDKFNELNID